MKRSSLATLLSSAFVFSGALLSQVDCGGNADVCSVGKKISGVVSEASAFVERVALNPDLQKRG